MNVGGAVSTTPLLGRLRGQVVVNLGSPRGRDRQSGLVLLVDVLSTDAFILSAAKALLSSLPLIRTRLLLPCRTRVTIRSSMILEPLFTGSMNVGGAVSTPLLGRLRGQVVNLDVPRGRSSIRSYSSLMSSAPMPLCYRPPRPFSSACP